MEPADLPDSAKPGRVTELLVRVQSGDEGAEGELMPLVYAELQGLARGIFSAQRAGHTLQPTALVHEAFLKLAGHLDSVEGKRHFLVLAGRAMRQIITDHARRKGTAKRGGGGRRVTLDLSVAAVNEPSVDLVALDDSLRRLAETSPRGAEAAELRLFSGLTIEETASVMGIPKRAVDREWALARAWLQTDLTDG